MRSTLLFIIALSQIGCYTVLRQSGAYYTEFSSEGKELIEDTTSFEETTGDVYNYYYSQPAPYSYYDPWYNPYRPYWYGGLATVVIDPWYYDYYYWGGCYYPGAYPHYQHYYPYYYNPPGGVASHRLQRPYGLRTTTTVALPAANLTTTRQVQWNGGAAGHRQYRTERGKSMPGSRATKGATAVRNKPSTKTGRTFNTGRSADSKPAGRSMKSGGSTSRTSKNGGGRQYKQKSDQP